MFSEFHKRSVLKSFSKNLKIALKRAIHLYCVKRFINLGICRKEYTNIQDFTKEFIPMQSHSCLVLDEIFYLFF